MTRFTFTAKDMVGVHAQIAGNLVREALKCSGDVLIRKGERQGNAKLIFHVMTLNIQAVDCVEITVSGDREQEEAAMLREFCEKYM